MLTSKTYKKHLLEHVRLKGRFACPFRNCNYDIITSVSRFSVKLLSHRRSHHEDREVFQVVAHNEQRLQDFVAEETDHHFDAQFTDGDEDMLNDDSDTEEEERKNFDCKFWALWLAAEFCHIIAESEITFLISKLRSLAQLSSNHLKKKLLSILPGNEAAIEQAFEIDDWLRLHFFNPNLATTARRESEANKRTRILRSRQNDTLPVFRTSIKTVIHLTGVAATIEEALEANHWEPNEHNGFPSEMEHVKSLRTYDAGLIASYRDSIRYREVEASIPPEERPGIHLQLYSDEFDRDLMSSSSKRHKVHVTYLRVLNVVDGRRRSPEEYRLLQILPSQVLHVNGYQTTMRPLVEDIISVVTNGLTFRGRKFGVRLAILQGDGLERAAMFGMASNFSKVSHCDPLSYLTTKTRIGCKTLQEILDEVQIGRDRQSYAEDLTHLHDLKLSRGLKYDSPFNRIPHYHVTDKGAVVFCISHDLYSGAFRSDMARVLLSLSELKHFSWKQLQDQFRMYRENLHGEDRQAWYDMIPDKKAFKQLPGNHSSNHLVIRFLSTFWLNKSAQDPLFQTTAWSLYLAMKKISELVSSKAINELVTQQLEKHVHEYLQVIN